MPFFRPFEPVSGAEVPSGEGWIAQVKWDGVRAVAEVSASGVEIWNRRGQLRTDRFPEIRAALAPFSGCAFDGEIVALHQGRPDFYRVLRRDRAGSRGEVERLAQEIPVWYAVFDVVRIQGSWVFHWPLAERLAWMVHHVKGVERVLATEPEDDTAALFVATGQLGLEGVVCKRVDSTYLAGGKDGRWIKVKHERNLTAVVGGVVFRDGAPSALMLGLYDDEQALIHVGNAGAGRLSQREWSELSKLAMARPSAHCPFAKVRATPTTCRFVQPAVAVKVRFLEWTEKHTLRHPVLLGWMDEPASPATCAFTQADA
ncbi:ATP-dependent DNA ligase [Alicyclobacillus vulcanalis]|uniref:DNA ligase (ATP) n=1 Tax=Alicyclobacillus vulcanalis TaxID=252246 RepID=A0A1N7NEG5_9BACL|nr:DNA ligase [Alicyclobacillus vulcanalis]SIS96803.1 bifunctional non-homologous end joining protein LigD [Alicyclobacillus vulcanalis]